MEYFELDISVRFGYDEIRKRVHNNLAIRHPHHPSFSGFWIGNVDHNIILSSPFPQARDFPFLIDTRRNIDTWPTYQYHTTPTILILPKRISKLLKTLLCGRTCSSDEEVRWRNIIHKLLHSASVVPGCNYPWWSFICPGRYLVTLSLLCTRNWLLLHSHILMPDNGHVSLVN